LTTAHIRAYRPAWRRRSRGGWLELPTLRNLAVCSRGTLAEGAIAERFSACSARDGAVHAAPG